MPEVRNQRPMQTDLPDNRELRTGDHRCRGIYLTLLSRKGYN